MMGSISVDEEFEFEATADKLPALGSEDFDPFCLS
jgi:hypothetical protein